MLEVVVVVVGGGTKELKCHRKDAMALVLWSVSGSLFQIMDAP